MNKSQEAVLNKFPYGRFEVFTKNLHFRKLNSKRAKKVLRQYHGSLFITETGTPKEEENAQDQTEVSGNL